MNLPPPLPETPYISVNQVADLLGVSEQTVRRYIREGRLPAYKFGGRVLIRPDDMNAMIRPLQPGAGR